MAEVILSLVECVMNNDYGFRLVAISTGSGDHAANIYQWPARNDSLHVNQWSVVGDSGSSGQQLQRQKFFFEKVNSNFNCCHQPLKNNGPSNLMEGDLYISFARK